MGKFKAENNTCSSASLQDILFTLLLWTSFHFLEKTHFDSNLIPHTLLPFFSDACYSQNRRCVTVGNQMHFVRNNKMFCTIEQKLALNFVDKWLSLSRYSLLAD
jgi:hypothetical protein